MIFYMIFYLVESLQRMHEPDSISGLLAWSKRIFSNFENPDSGILPTINEPYLKEKSYDNSTLSLQSSTSTSPCMLISY